MYEKCLKGFDQLCFAWCQFGESIYVNKSPKFTVSHQRKVKNLPLAQTQAIYVILLHDLRLS